MFFDGPFFMHMVAQDAAGLFFSGAVENPNTLNDGVLSLLYSLFEDGSFGLPWWCWYQFSAAAQVPSADVK